MVSQSLFLIPIAILAAPAAVESFSAPSRFGVSRTACYAPTAPLLASLSDLSSKEFQLEELEDREECETEVTLNDDGTVTLGVTNGPAVKEYRGDWHMLETAGEEDQPFRMRLTRAYDTGASVENLTHPSLRKFKSTSQANKVGDITYEVTREFWGNVEMVGESVSVSGKTHGNTVDSGNKYIDEQSLLESELGYFTLIDANPSE